MVKRQQQQAEEREKREQEMGNVEPGLKVNNNQCQKNI